MATDYPIKSSKANVNGHIVAIEPQPWDYNVKVWLAKKDPNTGKTSIATVIKNGWIEMKELKEDAISPEPFLILPMDFIQALHDALTQSVPPVPEQVVNAELKATKFHLEDMRKLVFKEKE